MLRRQLVTLEHQIRHSMGRAYQLKSELYCLLEGNRPIDAAAFHLECGRLMEEQMEVLKGVDVRCVTQPTPLRSSRVRHRAQVP